MTSSIADCAFIDTSVYVENFRNGRFKSELLDLPFLVRVSAVVLAELWRGARSRESQRAVAYLERNFPVVAPTAADWSDSGRLVAQLVSRRRYDSNKMREILFDVLIALTARQIGAYVITCNREDFSAIRRIKEFNLILW